MKKKLLLGFSYLLVENFLMLSRVERENSFITLGPALSVNVRNELPRF